MSEYVTIGTRYRGPPDSGNGGYTCGRLAAVLGGSDVEVVLLAPPPLERELRVDHANGQVRLLDGTSEIALARPVEGSGEVPAGAPVPMGYDAARAATTVFDLEAYRRDHEYPSCFTCGPDRATGDGLRIFPAVRERPGTVMCPWQPDASLCDETGSLDVATTWAALDCPGGLAWLVHEADLDALVLGTMSVAINRPPECDEHLEVVGWCEETAGRRRMARSAIYSEAGYVLAASRSTWVVLTEDQRKAFRPPGA